MSLGPLGIATDLAKRSEGFEKRVMRAAGISAAPYICPAGFWTIGYGHLCTKDTAIITLAEAEAYLVQDMSKAVRATLLYCPVLAMSDTKLAAIADFTFNLGAGRLQTSTLRRRINQGDWVSAASELRRWVHSGGRVLSGLVVRREAEVKLLLYGE